MHTDVWGFKWICEWNILIWLPSNKRHCYLTLIFRRLISLYGVNVYFNSLNFERLRSVILFVWSNISFSYPCSEYIWFIVVSDMKFAIHVILKDNINGENASPVHLLHLTCFFLMNICCFGLKYKDLTYRIFFYGEAWNTFINCFTL